MNTSVINILGTPVEITTIVIFLAIAGIIYLFYRIQKTEKLDFADMITKNGKTVSLTKILQLVGGITSTWVIIKLTLNGTLAMDMFAVYLTYVASIEGFSKFMAAKYRYEEKSVREAQYQDPSTYIEQTYQGPRSDLPTELPHEEKQKL